MMEAPRRPRTSCLLRSAASLGYADVNLGETIGVSRGRRLAHENCSTRMRICFRSPNRMGFAFIGNLNLLGARVLRGFICTFAHVLLWLECCHI